MPEPTSSKTIARRHDLLHALRAVAMLLGIVLHWINAIHAWVPICDS